MILRSQADGGRLWTIHTAESGETVLFMVAKDGLDLDTRLTLEQVGRLRNYLNEILEAS